MRPTESRSASRYRTRARRIPRVSLEPTLTHLQPTTLARILPLVLLVVLGACRNDGLGDAWRTTDGTNSVPVIAGAPPTRVAIGDTYDFVPDATDADGDVLTFSIENRPGWATFSPTTGRLTGRPPDSAADRVFPDIRISVSDTKAVAELPAYDLEVDADARPNAPPSISGSPDATATVGNSYGFTPQATDADGDALHFSIANRPSWATFDASSGALAGTPAEADVGTYTGIVISVSDGAASDSLPAFDIAVAAGAAPPPVNREPVISGSPATIATVGVFYSFQPTASDPDGQALTFGIRGKPGWASFNPANGRLSGTPGSAAVGVHENIVISVSDGAASAELPPFTITVSAPAPVESGSATLTWTRPTANEDGSPLTDLRGYRVYYGTSASALSSMVEIPDADITTAVIGGLAPATWYFGVKAYNTGGAESDFSNIASKRID